MRYALTETTIYTGETFLENSAAMVENGMILDVVSESDLPSSIDRFALGGGLLAPGFIDLQVNGGGGVLFNDTPTVETLEVIANVHAAYGVTAFLPTLLSDSEEVIKSAIKAVDEAIDANVPGVLGIHLEGPYLNRARKGVHDAAQIRAPSTGALELLKSCKRGWTLVTMAPEIAGTELIRELVEHGVLVAAGHTEATYEQIQDAVAQGLCCSTHLFNAMSQLDSRAPGVVGASLDMEQIFPTMIVDGHHVHPAAMRLAFAAKGADRLCLVSDAMPTVGTDLDEFLLQGQRILRRDGKLTTEDGTLAGADLSIAQAMRNALSMLGVELVEALRMVSLTPARLLGLADYRGWLAAGYRADMVHLNDMHQVVGTWIRGERVYG